VASPLFLKGHDHLKIFFSLAAVLFFPREVFPKEYLACSRLAGLVFLKEASGIQQIAILHLHSPILEFEANLLQSHH